MPQPLNAPEHAPRAPLWKPILFLLVVAVGLYYVKWQPYYGKAFVAADSHSIGKSIPPTAPRAPAGGPAVRAGLFHRGVEGGAARGAVRFAGAGADPARLAGAHARPPAFFRHRAGALIALPGMMCTCCAAPVAAGMRRQSVSSGAALAFLARQPGIEPGDAGVYGVCARLRSPPSARWRAW